VEKTPVTQQKPAPPTTIPEIYVYVVPPPVSLTTTYTSPPTTEAPFVHASGPTIRSSRPEPLSRLDLAILALLATLSVTCFATVFWLRKAR
jgi:hypothetical protein